MAFCEARQRRFSAERKSINREEMVYIIFNNIDSNAFSCSPCTDQKVGLMLETLVM